MTGRNRRLFPDHAVSRSRGNAISYILGFVLVLVGAHIVQAGPAAEGSKTNSLQSRVLVESLVSASQGGEKLIERKRIFDSLGAADGKMQVVVTLDSPGPTGRSLSSNLPQSQGSRQMRRAEVAAVQTRVLSGLAPSDVEIRTVYKNFPCFYAAVTANALTRLMENPHVKHIEPVRKLTPFLRQGIPVMRAASVRSASGGAGVAIAIVDSGVDYTHPQLGDGSFPNSKVIAGVDKADGDEDPYPYGSAGGHGTACAGIAAGSIRYEGDYIGGVAPEAKLVAVKVRKDDGTAVTPYLLDGIEWCIDNRDFDGNNPIMVISVSVGVAGEGFTSASQCDAAYPSFVGMVNRAIDEGITVLAASGNDGYCDSLAFPAALSPVISVGAVYDADIGNRSLCVSSDTCYAGASPSNGCDKPDLPWRALEGSTYAEKVACYSNSASFLDILAPGNSAYTTDISGDAGYNELGDYTSDFGGTSAACPYAAGAVALLQSAAKATRGSFLSPAEVRSLLTSTGKLIADTKNGGLSPSVRTPLVNVDAAFDAMPPAAYVDIGLRVYDGKAIVRIACEPAGTLTSPLRIAKNGRIYGIVLVAPSDPHASGIKVTTASGVKALRKL